jgi:hypothetical protein
VPAWGHVQHQPDEVLAAQVHDVWCVLVRRRPESPADEVAGIVEQRPGPLFDEFGVVAADATLDLAVAVPLELHDVPVAEPALGREHQRQPLKAAVRQQRLGRVGDGDLAADRHDPGGLDRGVRQVLAADRRVGPVAATSTSPLALLPSAKKASTVPSSCCR